MKIPRLLFVLCALVPLLCGCSAESGTVPPLNAALAALGEGAPPLIVCRANSAEYESDYFDEALLAAMFGEEGEFPERALFSEVSFFVSSSQKFRCEAAVFLLSDAADAAWVKKVVSRRAQIIESAARGGKTDASECAVSSRGRYIFFAAGERCADMLSAMLSAAK